MLKHWLPMTLYASMAIAIAGCASMSPEERAAKGAELNRTVPTCSSTKECEVKWSAARQWILTNSGWKIQTMTNEYMETFNSVGSSTELAVQVQKLAQADGSYKIAVKVWCDNIYGCRIPPLDAAIHFNQFVTSAWKPQ